MLCKMLVSSWNERTLLYILWTNLLLDSKLFTFVHTQFQRSASVYKNRRPDSFALIFLKVLCKIVMLNCGLFDTRESCLRSQLSTLLFMALVSWTKADKIVTSCFCYRRHLSKLKKKIFYYRNHIIINQHN